MRSLSYHKPKTVKEAIALLGRHGERAAILAGGTDLLVEWKKRLRAFSHIIDLKGISSLKGIEFNPQGHLRIGPLTTMQALASSPALMNGLRVLSEAASRIGSWQIRNRATIGGNVCHASPSGDTLPALLCLNAQLKLEGPQGGKIVPVEDFFLGPGESIAVTEEILTEILIPPLPRSSCGVYRKFALRRAMDLAVVGVAVLGSLDPIRDRIEDIRIGLGAVAPTPIRAKKAEDFLTGRKIDEDIIEETATLASEEARPVSDIRGSEWYRREMIKHIVAEAIQEVLEKIRQGEE